MAITTKARAKGLLRDARALLADKTLPKDVHDALGAVATALKKKWSDLETEAKDSQADAQGDQAKTDAKTADTQEALSHRDTESLLRAALRAESQDKYRYVVDVYDTWFVYSEEDAGGSFKRSFVIDDQGQVTLGEPQQVIPTIVYIPVAEALRALEGPTAAPVQEATPTGAQEIVGEIVPLVEGKAGKSGTVPVKVIAPGWGSSGYYSPEVLKRDGPKAFPAGTQMYWNHATPTEEAQRPEGDLSNLAAVLTATPTYQENGAAGPGLYSEAKVFAPFAEALGELAPHIGVSIRGQGIVKAGEADGRKGLIVEKLLTGRSVDFVTQPGAGGQVLSLFEAARGARVQEGRGNPDPTEGEGMNEQEAGQLRESNRQLAEENKRLAEALLLREARDLAAGELGRMEMPEMTRARLTEVLASRPVLKDGKLDVDATKARIAEAAKDELAYLAGVTGSGRIAGMGSQPAGAANAVEAGGKLEAAMLKLGLSESAAKTAAGR